MIRRAILMALLAVACVTTFASEAFAGAWTVYIFNVRRPYEGSRRAGVSYQSSPRAPMYWQIYTTEAECKRGIAARVAENKRLKSDFEDFEIVYQNASPPSGVLKSYVRKYWQYRPSNGKWR